MMVYHGRSPAAAHGHQPKARAPTAICSSKAQVRAPTAVREPQVRAHTAAKDALSWRAASQFFRCCRWCGTKALQGFALGLNVVACGVDWFATTLLKACDGEPQPEKSQVATASMSEAPLHEARPQARAPRDPSASASQDRWTSVSAVNARPQASVSGHPSTPTTAHSPEPQASTSEDRQASAPARDAKPQASMSGVSSTSMSARNPEPQASASEDRRASPSACDAKPRAATSGDHAAAASEDPPLSAKQEELIHRVLVSKQSVFFTGAAGTGKSLTLRELIRRAPEESTFVTALTGIASTQLLRGSTLHSFAGFGLAKGSKEQCLEDAKRSAKARKHWAQVLLLIIDEISMMSKALFEKLEYVARKMKAQTSGQEMIFGGVVVCLCGDFFQLPPVSRKAVGDDACFCFESDSWTHCLATPSGTGQHCYELKEVFRQKDSRLLELLSEVRYGKLSKFGLQTLSMLSRELVVKEGVEPTRLFGTNKQADFVNQERLAALEPGKFGEISYTASDSDLHLQMAKSFISVDSGTVDEMTMFPRELVLKVGAQVMLLKNTTSTLVNGSRGVVESFQRGKQGKLLPFVRFLNGETKLVEQEDDKKDLAGGKGFVRSQLPLKLCWAITIHKSQGMSIDYLEIDLAKIFEAGQAYVALSRARSLDGLRVVHYDARKFWTSPKVVEFYQKRVQPI